MSIDYRTLLGKHGEERWATTFLYDAASTILATRIPDLCPDCKGTDIIRSSKTPPPGFEFTLAFCGHSNAPTIADLLRWGENVARTKERPDRESCVEFNGFLYGDTPDLLAALRTEADR